MKRCPLCNRTFSDDNQFCLEDGTILSSIEAMPTEVYSGDIPTVVVPKIPPTQHFENQTQFQPPPQFQVPQSSPQIQTNSGGKWIYPLLGLLIGAVVILGFLLFYQSSKKDETVSTNANSAKKETPKPSETLRETPTAKPTETAFSYNPNVGKYPEGSTRLLNEGDIYGKSNWELRIMRNEIFARHGRRFKRADLRNYFMQQPWYNPRFDEVRLTDLEKRNVEFLRAYE